MWEISEKGLDLKKKQAWVESSPVWEISEDGLDLKNSTKKPVWEILMDVKSSPDILVIVGCYDWKVKEKPINVHVRN